MKKLTKTNKLALATQTITKLTNSELGQVVGGMMLTRPYTKVSVCVGGACATEFC